MTAPSANIKLFRGALVILDANDAVKNAIGFQFNPEKVNRVLKPRYDQAENRRATANYRYLSAPEETLTLTIEVDAVDQFDSGKGDWTPDATGAGVLPQLNALELLLYPALDDYVKSTQKLDSGSMETAGLPVPDVLLVWGADRVVPVLVTSMTIDETLFDPNLNPIHAKVTLSLQVVSYSDLAYDSPPAKRFQTYQRKKESTARYYGFGQDQAYKSAAKAK